MHFKYMGAIDFIMRFPQSHLFFSPSDSTNSSPTKENEAPSPTHSPSDSPAVETTDTTHSQHDIRTRLQSAKRTASTVSNRVNTLIGKENAAVLATVLNTRTVSTTHENEERARFQQRMKTRMCFFQRQLENPLLSHDTI